MNLYCRVRMIRVPHCSCWVSSVQLPSPQKSSSWVPVCRRVHSCHCNTWLWKGAPVRWCSGSSASDCHTGWNGTGSSSGPAPPRWAGRACAPCSRLPPSQCPGTPQPGGNLCSERGSAASAGTSAGGDSNQDSVNFLLLRQLGKCFILHHRRALMIGARFQSSPQSTASRWRWWAFHRPRSAPDLRWLGTHQLSASSTSKALWRNRKRAPVGTSRRRSTWTSLLWWGGRARGCRYGLSILGGSCPQCRTWFCHRGAAQRTGGSARGGCRGAVWYPAGACLISIRQSTWWRQVLK